MSNLQEVPTEELLSFHDYPVVHQNPSSDQAQINVTINDDNINNFDAFQKNDALNDPLERDSGAQNKVVSIWSLDYYQKFFDVDTSDVTGRILASITPKPGNSLGRQIMEKPDLYGPFWIATTLVFTLAISGNISNYLYYADSQYHWRYDFKLVSYAATAIWVYVLLVPLAVWGTLKWSTEDLSFNEEERPKTLGLLELICIYGYCLFAYIPASVLWTIHLRYLQWIFAIVSALVSGYVLLSSLSPHFKASRHRLALTFGILICHVLLGAVFVLWFFPDIVLEHANPTVISHTISSVSEKVLKNVTKSAPLPTVHH